MKKSGGKDERGERGGRECDVRDPDHRVLYPHACNTVTHNFPVTCTLCFEVKWFLKNRNLGSQLNLSYITRN